MKPRLLLVAFAAGLVLAPAAPAAPAPSEVKNQAGPAIALQVKSIDQLLSTVKTAAKNFLPDDAYKEFEKNALSKLSPSVLKGIDPKKPFGMYATIGNGLLLGDFSKSSLVVLVPVTNENDFVDLLKQAELSIEKKGDVYTIPLPNFPMAASMRFLKGYAYMGIAGEKLDPKLLLDPQDVIIDKETAAAVLRVRVDRIPDELKQAVQTLLADFAEQTREKMKNDFKLAEAKELLDDFFRISARWLRATTEEVKEIVLRVDLDAKTGGLLLETSAEAKSNTALAKSFAGLKATKNDFANIVGPDSAAHVLIQYPLYIEDVQTLYGGYIDVIGKLALKEGLKNEPKELQDLAAEALATMSRTVKSGNMDFAASLRGPDKNDQYTAVAACSLKETAALEKALKAALKLAPKDVGDLIKPDAFKIDGINVHEMAVGELLPPEAQKIFGKSSVYAALTPNAAFVTFGPRGKEVMKEVLTSKLGPKPAPLMHIEVSGKRLMPLIKNSGAPLDGPAGQLFAKLGKMDRISVWSTKLEGGERLVIRQEIGVVPLMWVFWTGRSAKAEFNQVAPVLPPQKIAPADVAPPKAIEKPPAPKKAIDK